MPVLKPGCSPNYDHSKYFPTLVDRYRKVFGEIGDSSAGRCQSRNSAGSSSFSSNYFFSALPLELFLPAAMLMVLVLCDLLLVSKENSVTMKGRLIIASLALLLIFVLFTITIYHPTNYKPPLIIIKKIDFKFISYFCAQVCPYFVQIMVIFQYMAFMKLGMFFYTRFCTCDDT